jgi:hypothetical protein
MFPGKGIPFGFRAVTVFGDATVIGFPRTALWEKSPWRFSAVGTTVEELVKP